MDTANKSSGRQSRGFTLVEATAAIAVVGVMAGIAVVGFGGVLGNSKDTIARNLVETLNKATRNFSHANWDLKFNAIAGNAGEEMLVLRSLQWREPDGDPNEKEIIYSGPYMRSDWNPATSSDVKDWRIEWSGSSWRLLLPGTAGAGLKVDFDGIDQGTPYVFPPNFKPVGSK